MAGNSPDSDDRCDIDKVPATAPDDMIEATEVTTDGKWFKAKNGKWLPIVNKWADVFFKFQGSAARLEALTGRDDAAAALLKARV